MESMFARSLSFSLSVCLLAGGWSASAQIATTGQVVGSVEDSTGAVMPGVSLRLKNASTGSVQTTASAVDGGFVFPSAPPGSYHLTAELTGFETAVYRNIVVNAGRTTNHPIVLKVGAATETVEISGAAPALQVTSTTIANTVEQKYLQDLPL